MAEILLFIRDGWKNLWKQKIIWLFSAMPLVSQILRVIYWEHKSDLFWSFLYTASGILIFVSFIAVPYLLCSTATGKIVTIEETLYATGKFLWRIIGCSCLGILLLSPYLFLIFVLSFDNSTQPPHFSNTLIFMSLPFALFAAIPGFMMFGFFANDWGIRQSFKNAWTLFTAHFGVLALLGIIIAIISRIYIVACGILTVLIQSRFDMVSLNGLNYINPSTSLINNMLFVLLSGFNQVFFTPFNYSLFVAAFLKYSQSKKH